MLINKIKKTSNYSKIITENGTLVNESRHYPSSIKEWYNNGYFYNNNNSKHLPSLHISITKLIKSYFNMFNLNLEKSVKLRRIALWKRRLKLNRILIGKPEFKHTNDKVIITLYLYNRQLSVLNFKLKNLKRKLLLQYFIRVFVKNQLLLNKIKYITNIIKNISKIRWSLFSSKMKKLRENQKLTYKLNLKKNVNNWKLKKSLIFFKNYKTKIIESIVMWENYNNIKKSANKFNISVARSLRYTEKKLKKLKYMPGLNKKSSITKIFFKSLKSNNMVNKLYQFINKHINKEYYFNINKIMYLNILKKQVNRMRLYLRYNKVVYFNKLKFSVYVKPLKLFLVKVFKKDVEINIVSLKDYHLDSNIFTQVMAIKLRNRKNRLLRIIRKALIRIKLPFNRRLQYYSKLNFKSYIQNMILTHNINKNYYYLNPILNINTKINNSYFKKLNLKTNKLNMNEYNNDKLYLILKSLYPTQYTTVSVNDNVDNLYKINLNRFLLKRNVENTVLDNIKYKTISGVRVEASGRLSKRLIASKAIFKMRQKGTIRNIDSSYKEMSTVLLRGNMRSNLQYSHNNNKTRIGAFGIKGWISSI